MPPYHYKVFDDWPLESSPDTTKEDQQNMKDSAMAKELQEEFQKKIPWTTGSVHGTEAARQFSVWLMENYKIKLKWGSYLNKPAYKPTDLGYWSGMGSNTITFNLASLYPGIDVPYGSLNAAAATTMARLAEENKALKKKLREKK